MSMKSEQQKNKKYDEIIALESRPCVDSGKE